MSGSDYRLSGDEEHALCGHQIERQHGISFSLNGIEVSGFKGDTILSALLGAGITSVGTHLGRDLALDETLDLLVRSADKDASAENWLPIARTPAIDGSVFVTMNPPRNNVISRLMAKLSKTPTRSLGIDLALSQPRLDLLARKVTAEAIEADVVVIGGGLAGLTAAMLASNAGKSVVVVEQRPYLGGDAVLFGQTADEDPPEVLIEKLTATLISAANVRLMLATKAISANNGTIVAHGLDMSDALPQGRFFNLKGAATVIATGGQDRLPVFAGNRLPGIVGLATAFHLSAAYGVWPGQSVTMATSTNAAYRLARLGHDGGASISKIIDSRVVPQSRFIEFSKAYGIVSESGLKLDTIAQAPATAKYTLNFARSWQGGSGHIDPLETDAMIISGGWLPRLGLWQQLGGRIETDADNASLRPADGPDNVVLAGGCAGHISTRAVIDSGVAAIEEILGRSVREVVETIIDPVFETPDGPLPVSTTASDEDAPAYLSGGNTLVVASAPPPPKHFLSSLFGSGDELEQVNTLGEALELGDLGALMALDRLMPADFGAVANERAILVREFEPALPAFQAREETKSMREGLAPYMQGRFGRDSVLCEILMEDGPAPEVGGLIFANSDISDPLLAIGTVTAKTEVSGRARILLQNQFFEAGRRVSAHGTGGHGTAIVVEATMSLNEF